MTRELGEHTIEGRVDECARIDALLDGAGRRRGLAGCSSSASLAPARPRSSPGPGCAPAQRRCWRRSATRERRASRTAPSPISCAASATPCPRCPRTAARRLLGATGLGPARGDPDGLALGAALMQALEQAAAERPVLVVVDDAQWLDGASAPVLAFALRRLAAEPVGVLVGARPGPHGLDALNLTELRLRGLDDEAALALLAARGAAPEVARRIVAVSGGNPLALTELARVLGPERLAGRAPLPDPLPVAGGVERLYGARIAALPADARGALLLLALADAPSAAEHAHAERALGIGGDVLEALEAAALVELGPAASPSPTRSCAAAAVAGATPAERRRAHAALAAPSRAPARWSGARGIGRRPRCARTTTLAARARRRRGGRRRSRRRPGAGASRWTWPRR